MEQKLTVWEAKARTAQIACETKEWRQKRLIAENPNTTADALLMLARSVVARNHSTDVTLLYEALLTHSNLRPDCIVPLLKSFAWHRRSHSSVFAAFCRNPLVPFLSLELPTFWRDIPSDVCLKLLVEGQLSPVALAAFKNCVEGAVAQEAHLHIAATGELPLGRDGEKALTNYWKTDCAKNPNFAHNDCPSAWRFQLAKLGIAPYWAAELPGPRRASAKKATTQTSTLPYRRYLRYGIPPVDSEELVEFVRTEQSVPAFARFTAIPCGAYPIGYLYAQSLLPDGLARLHAALRLPLTEAPFSNDPWRRSPNDLMNYLAHDGNRFVRWAAQTRLADPDFAFTWHEDAD